VFRIDYGGESKLEINTTKKYNTGEWVNVETGREYKVKGSTEEGMLRVNNLEPKFGSPTSPITQKMIPDFKSSLYYLGGVPPGFSSGSTKAPGADYAFLGCMKDVLINGATYDPLESSQYYGVEPSCKERITRAGFYGNGFVELPSYSLRRAGNFGLVFRTLQPECLLLLSAYPPDSSIDFDGQDIRGNYSVSLVGGRVFVWMDAGKGRIELSSNVTLNDGEYHVINVVKRGRKIDLRINDEFQMSKNLPSSPVAVHAPEDIGGLYIGGAPDFAAFDLLAPTFVSFEGAIKDLVFNNKTVSFDQALNSSNVHLGRIGPAMGSQGLQMALMKTEPIGRSFKATPEGCHRVSTVSELSLAC
jgi:laminin, alpha 1/2